MPSSHLILCRPLLLLPPIPPSIRVFSSESTLRMRWPKYWSFSLNIIPSKEIPGLISFRMDCLDLLEVQGTLKTLFQHHSSKASILRHSAFFTVQLSHPHRTFWLFPKENEICFLKVVVKIFLLIQLFMCSPTSYPAHQALGTLSAWVCFQCNTVPHLYIWVCVHVFVCVCWNKDTVPA